MRSSRHGWIFSPRGDVLAFSAPVLVGLVIALGYLAFDRPTVVTADILGQRVHLRLAVIMTLFATFGDIPHVYATYLRLGLERDRLRRDWLLYVGVPVVLFVTMGMVARVSILGVWSLIAYVNFFHTMRQQYGWMVYSRMRAGEISRIGYRMDQLMLYNATALPMLWLHTRGSQGWLVDDDLLTLLPQSIGPPLLVTHWLFNAAYVAWTVWAWRQGQGLNLAKVQIVLTTWVAWYLGIVHLYEVPEMIDFLHAVPYLMIVFAYGRKKWSSSGGIAGWVFGSAGWLTYLAPLVIVGFAAESTLGKVISGLVPPHWFVAIYMLPPMAHYVLDGFIWKTRSERNPDLSHVLALDTG